MKAADKKLLHSSDKAQLLKKVTELEAEVIKIRGEMKLGKVKNVKQIKNIKNQIAIIKTIITQKNRNKQETS